MGTTRTSVVRRVVLTFALTALLPALVTSALAYFAVDRQLTAKSLEQLRQESKNYGLRVLQQLQLAQSLLASLSALEGGESSGLEDSYFSEIVVADSAVSEREAVRRPGASSAPAPAHLKVTGVAAGAGVWMSIASSTGSLVSGRLKPSVLWGSPETFPPFVKFCVLDENAAVIFCPSPPSDAAMREWRAALQESAVGELRWREGEQAYLAGYFTVPLRPSFSSQGWSVATIEEEAHALAAMAGFRAIFPPAIALSVVLAIWVSFYQVRLRLNPLQVLAHATSRIAAGDFSKDLELPGDDEFGSLADSFNGMRRDLERQFGTLKALSELDRKILDATGLQPMAEVTVQRMLEIFASRCAAIVIVAQDAGHIAQIIWCAQDLQVGVERIELSSADRLLLKGSGAATQIGADENAPFLDALSGSGAAVYRVLPVILKGELAGALVLGYSKDDLPGHGSEESLQDFGDRLAVAMQAIDRAELLYKRAHYDGLTSLPNRQLFDDRLKLAIAQSRSRGHNSALLFVDLDHFKTVNDSEGHAIGDELLRLAAQRLQDCVAAGDTVARLGGDEFAVILSAISSPHDAAQIADKIIAALSEPFQIAVMEHFISASIGIAMIPADGSTVGELLRSADTALYKAKDLGRKRRVFFEDDMNRNAEERVRLFSDLQHAIERGEFVLHYQAKFDLETRRTVGAEALIRWQHPTRGLVSPAVFIPLAEETGLIVEIGDWVIAEAARQLGAWLGRGIIGKLSLNVSYRQLRDGDVLRSLISASRSHGLPPGSLEVEFTESMLAEDKAAIFRALAELREAGFPIAIDDFGTGYSSFSYLSELPFDVIKLDQAFLEDFPFVQSRTAIVAGILEIARVLGKSIVAEGVETEEQRIALLRHGCTVGQGYLFGRPVCAAEFEASVACETPAIARISGL